MPAKIKWTAEMVLEEIQRWAREHGEPPSMIDWNPWHARNIIHDEQRARRFETYPRPLPYFTTVVNRFGSWNTAISAAGFVPRSAHGGDGNQRRQRSSQKTHCVHGHEYTEENTYVLQRTGWRYCKTCARAARARSKARRDENDSHSQK